MFEFKKTSHLQKRRIVFRIWVAGIFALLCFGGLLGRLWFLQVDRYEGLAARANQNRIAVVPIPPRRGEIVDRRGVVLARNYRDYTLDVVPAHVADMKKMLDELGQLVYISPLDRRRFKQRMGQTGRYAHVLLRNNLNDTEAAWFSAHAYEFPGVSLRARWVREYPQGASAAHVLGFVGRISESDLAKLDDEGRAGNYRGTDVIGKKGIEKTWEDALHGHTGLEEVEVTAGGRPVRVLRRVDPVPGSNLVLSLDIGLQKEAEKLFEGKRGALVAIDPKTGDVLAFVSSPSFDPNLFIDGIDVENWRRLNDSPDHPLVDRALYGTYPIGSTYKPFVALAALELGKRSATQIIPDPGYFEFAGQKYRNAAGAVFGPTDMHRALVVSSDTYFFSLGPVIGVDALHDFTKQFGFGQLTGIDLDGERRGVLPSTEWKRHAFKKPSQQHWFTGESVSVAVGQGYNAFTILQLAQATSVLANNGVYMKPHLVSLVENPQTGKSTPIVTKPSYTIPLKPENLKVVKDALVDVIRYGTARRAFIGAKYQAAGKTGTAQLYSLKGAKYHAGSVNERLRDHALFMAYAPAEDPRIAVALIVENGGWGASVAAPIARQVFDYWLSPDRHENENYVTVPASLKDDLPHAPSGAAGASSEESPDAVVPPEDRPDEDEGPADSALPDMRHGPDAPLTLTDSRDARRR
ncbi:penicillin-binding protein 2 [Paralcaligenes ureilyticus]|uniref:Peptidoglycan D,D-transpeptidase MrdA n=1 Tax=Paralcaligenes ureilyticus TaxID=627131 RepID=A0A4R3LMH1_9BURK|nr:penicillin-binding protein 2 [Paralcaligenes ureilyticus]TCT01494.1 peptidoglycan glycosyltransferase /cell elongation-specific peptidoglycan D,D-transpeptidase [Paralcaligenes ureilyticus]